MDLKDLDFKFPPHLVATEKKPISRVMYVVGDEPVEVTPSYILTQIEPNDVLVINDTKVIKARVISADGMEVLFIENIEENLWKVLCPAKKWPLGKVLQFPGGLEVEMVEKGMPQTVRTSIPIDFCYFNTYGDIPLPPYIQQARGERPSRDEDQIHYQTAWAEHLGSLAAPTASLHFSLKDIEKVKKRGATVVKLCLHVGLGTFIPIQTTKIEDHVMHGEWVSIPLQTWESIQDCKKRGGKVWALGSTVTRAVESMSLGMLKEDGGEFRGSTNLYIQPGFRFQIVDVLMTNFHTPQSTLIAMVMAFAGVDKLRRCYQWAMERQFRLFSYGDLSVWRR